MAEVLTLTYFPLEPWDKDATDLITANLMAFISLQSVEYPSTCTTYNVQRTFIYPKEKYFLGLLQIFPSP